ncbi:uncharacterized protein LOC143182277 [Calliopsis andreniformis]|uniref:uncharacterized protein LOC143182277 n=1 Tax=Calliopsis andreniformis TaxID=337506 RepID=UPI003FCD19C8
MPKLRKNRRIETRWGVKYYTAVRDVVFVTQAHPYVPAEPPPSLKQHASPCETLYICAQCKDCFHFQSSLEDHRARKSWILGYWCQQCFMTICTHNSSESSTCSDCSQIDRDKRVYLRSKGLHKSQKFGAIRIFYNQCQFLAHLKAHSITYVHMGDLMLMPIPTNMTHDWGPEIDIACEALMEYTFVMKIHIMDWLKQRNIDHSWWQLATKETEDKNNLIANIVKSYKGRHYFKPLDIPIEEQFSTLNSSHSMFNNSSRLSDIEITDSTKINDKSLSITDTTTSTSDESVIENEDNPCTINDIAFVDCGPASTHFEPETPINNMTRKNATVFVKSVPESSIALQSANLLASKLETCNLSNSNSISSDIVMSYGNTMIMPKVDVKDSAKSLSVLRKSTKNSIPVTESNITKADKKSNKAISEDLLNTESCKTQSDISCEVKMNTCKNKSEKLKQDVHTLTINSGQKVFTLQSTKHIDINTIINQLPPQIVNNKKILLVGQDSNAVTFHNKQDLSPKKVVQLVPDLSSAKDMKSIQAKTVESQSLSESSSKHFSKSILKNQVDSAKTKSQSSLNKILYQNGRKYIIKRTLDVGDSSKAISNVTPAKGIESKSVNNIPPLIPLNSTDLENISTQERVNSFHGDVTPLTPSPSPSELSNSSSSDIQSKQSSLTAKGAQKVDTSRSNAKANVSTNNPNDLFESLSFHKGEDENLYLDIKFYAQKPIYTIVDTSAMITKCKHEMLNEFFHLSYSELKKRFEHLQQVNDEIVKVMDFVADNVVKENLKAVNILKHVLKHCIDKCTEKVDETSEKDTPLSDWESEGQDSSEKSVCKSCNKAMKPKSYIPGFSTPTKNEMYCSCYRHVCYKCNTYQGNSTRFVAHQTFHDKQKPYLCPDCYRKFATFKSLEIHTWTSCFHTLKRRFLGCKICEINGFQDMESIARHFSIMHSHNRIACENCYLVLPSYTEYKKHHKEKHSDLDEHPIRLVLCKLGRCIVRCEEYMLHMEKHLVVQRLIWFKCPFCIFVNIEAKRILFHLQTKHSSRLEEIVSPEVLWCLLPLEMAVKSLKTNPSQNKFVNAYQEPCNDGTVVPKIINTRTITSEVFERGAQDTDDGTANADTLQRSRLNANRRSSISNKTPKILEVRSMANLSLEDKCEENETSKSSTENLKSKRTIEENGVGNPRNLKKEIKATKKAKDLSGSLSDSEAIKKKKSGDSFQQGCLSKVKANTNGINKKSSNSSKNRSSSAEKKLKTVEAKETNGTSSNVQTQKQTESSRQVPISKPPPLARIPRLVIENRSTKSVQTVKGGKTASRNHKTSQKVVQRIALNGPNNTKEADLNFSCHLCGELINTSQSVITSHFEKKHSQDCKLSIITSRLLRISSEFINGGYKDLLGTRKRKSDNVSSGSKRRRRWTPKKYNEGKNANFPGIGLCVTQETAEDSEGKFRCKKCDQRCSDMVDLREHIASEHRIRGRYLICLECGENFVVAPSLQMHLKAFHGIEDPITYMAQNTSYAPDSIDDFEIEGKAIEANQCHVCMAVFENKAAVDKHLRVHGMAFLNRKRIEAQNALKSPEKKDEVEKEKEATTKPAPKQHIRRDKPAETILEKINATM